MTHHAIMGNEIKIERLYLLLDEAEELAKQFTGGYSNNFLSAEDFHTALSDSIAKFKAGDTDQLNELRLWFAPTCDWDDLIRHYGQDLANEIFPLADELRDSLGVYSLTDLITDYQKTVEKVVRIFERKFKVRDLLTAYRHDKIYPQIGKIREHNIKRYAFHGIGLSVDFEDSTCVDFDFAFLPEQRHDGFDLWRLGLFVSNHPNKYQKYLDKEKLENDFNKLIERGVIINPDVIPSTTLYFFRSSLMNKISPRVKNKDCWWKKYWWKIGK